VLEADVLDALIRDNIAADTWDEDPANLLRISDRGVMTVNQQPEVQTRIRALLDDLREIAGMLREAEPRHRSGR